MNRGWPNAFRRTAVAVEEARKLALQAAAPVPAERVPLLKAYGRRSAAAVRATEPVPHFRRSGMDGYAVIAADTASADSAAPAQLRVIGEIACGEAPRAAVTPGTAMRIMTGAMLPEGADAVIMLEMTSFVETADGSEAIAIRRSIAPGTNVSGIGSDLAAGTAVLERGEVLGAAELALLATIGHAEAEVFRKPRVGIIATGTELLSPSEPLSPGKIRNSNSYMLAAQAMSAGAEPTVYEAVKDERAGMLAAVTESLGANDLVMTTGGVSVGDYDVMTELLLRTEGCTILFNKVQMRPGSVTSAAVWNGKLLFALSGNPGACFAGFELFVRPALKAMQGCADGEPAVREAVLAKAYPKGNAYPRYIRGRCWSDGGRLMTAPETGDRSSRLLPGLGADCFVVIPPGGSGCEAGTVVQIIPLEP